MSFTALKAAARRPGAYAAGTFLVLAFFLGGLRSPAAWLAFSVLFLPWFVLDGLAFRPEEHPAVLLFFFWLAAAAVFSPDPRTSAASLAACALPGIFYFSAVSCPEGEKGWLRAIKFLGALSSAALIVQRFSGMPVFGLIGANPNYSAAFAAAAFPAALLSADGNRRDRIAGAVLALLLAGGVLASGSRGALAAAFLSAAAALALAGRRRTLAGLGLAALLSAALLPGAAWEVLLKLSDPRAFQRPQLWGAALEIAGGSPLLGAGPGLFGQAFEAVKFPFFDGISWYGHSTPHAHGELFNLAAEAGFPAAVFFALAVWTALAGRFREQLPLAACAAAVFIQGCVDIILYSGAAGLLLWGTLGFVSGGKAGEPAATGEPADRGIRVKLAAAVLAAAGLASVFITAPGVRGSLAAAGAEEAALGHSPALMLALVRSKALDAPKDPFLARGEARVFSALDFQEPAEAALRRALELEPYYYEARLDLAELYAGTGRAAQARALLEAMPDVPAVTRHNPYQYSLAAFDRARYARLKNILWKKNATGGTTASGRRTR